MIKTSISNLPKSWIIENVSKITNNLDNRRIPLNQAQRSEKEGDGSYPYVGANNIVGYIDEYIFDEKILCIAEDGGSWGYNEICAFIMNEKCWVNNHAHVLSAKSNLILEYLKYYLNYADLNLYINGATRGKLNQSALNKIKIPMPPLAEQQKIAAILDAADSLRQKDQQLVERYTALSQALFLEMFGDPVTNPKGWDAQSLESITTKIGSGSTPRGGKEAYYDKGISLIRSLNIHDNKFLMKNLAFIDEKQAKELANVTVEANDVLLNITGASVCRCAIVPKEVLPARVNQHVCILRCNSNHVNPYYLLHLIISTQFKQKLLNIAGANGATREALTKSQSSELSIVTPPIALQNQFAERIQLIEAQKQQAQLSLAKSEALFNSLLQRAFTGELTAKMAA